MGKRIRIILLLSLAAVFLGSAAAVLGAMGRYQEEDRVYDQAAAEFLRETEGGAAAADGTDVADLSEIADRETAPIEVDFRALREVCGDVEGWIYCEGTPINYPVVQGEDNDYYLRRSYEGTKMTAGSIFVDAGNRRGFADSNTVIYGHHMKNGSMFACLEDWEEQGFYEEHPVMWLLTPEQDYKIVLFSGYTTAADSDTYQIFQGPGRELEEYLEACADQSDFQSDVELDGDARYVVLSTCAYSFTNARHVLHGMLVPAGSAGGVKLP